MKSPWEKGQILYYFLLCLIFFKVFLLSLLHTSKIAFLVTVVPKLKWRTSGLWWVRKEEKQYYQPVRSASILKGDRFPVHVLWGAHFFLLEMPIRLIWTEYTLYIALGLYSNFDYSKFLWYLGDYWKLILVSIAIDTSSLFLLLKLNNEVNDMSFYSHSGKCLHFNYI